MTYYDCVRTCESVQSLWDGTIIESTKTPETVKIKGHWREPRLPHQTVDELRIGSRLQTRYFVPWERTLSRVYLEPFQDFVDQIALCVNRVAVELSAVAAVLQKVSAAITGLQRVHITSRTSNGGVLFSLCLRQEEGQVGGDLTTNDSYKTKAPFATSFVAFAHITLLLYVRYLLCYSASSVSFR